MCDSKETLIAYLYDDISDAERRSYEVHLAGCLECRNELAGLRQIRSTLASWSPAEPEVGFQIVSQSPRRTRTREGGPSGWFSAFRPAWGLAAAAVLVLAAGAAIANLDIRYSSDGLAIRTGWSPRAAATTQGQAVPGGEGQNVASITARDFARLESRLQALETSVAARGGDPAIRQASAQGSGPRVQGSGDAEVLREVRELLSQSESRQQRELALRVGQVIKDFERQRRIDMATIQQGLQGATGAEAVAHRQMMDYVSGLYRVSQTVK